MGTAILASNTQTGLNITTAKDVVTFTNNTGYARRVTFAIVVQGITGYGNFTVTGYPNDGSADYDAYAITAANLNSETQLVISNGMAPTAASAARGPWLVPDGHSLRITLSSTDPVDNAVTVKAYLLDYEASSAAIQSSTLTAQNIHTGITVSTNPADADQMVVPLVILTGLAASAATLTLAADITDGDDLSYIDSSLASVVWTRTKAPTNSTVQALGKHNLPKLEPFFVPEGSTLTLKITSSNASDTSVGVVVIFSIMETPKTARRPIYVLD